MSEADREDPKDYRRRLTDGWQVEEKGEGKDNTMHNCMAEWRNARQLQVNTRTTEWLAEWGEGELIREAKRFKSN